MTEDEERLKNLVIFKVPMTDAELGLDKPMPTWAVCVIIGVFAALLIGAVILLWR